MTDHDEIERVLAALDGGRMYVGPKDDRNVTKKAVARIIRELRDELAASEREGDRMQDAMVEAEKRAAKLESQLSRPLSGSAAQSVRDLRSYADVLTAVDRKHDLRDAATLIEQQSAQIERLRDALQESSLAHGLTVAELSGKGKRGSKR